MPGGCRNSTRSTRPARMGGCCARSSSGSADWTEKDRSRRSYSPARRAASCRFPLRTWVEVSDENHCSVQSRYGQIRKYDQFVVRRRRGSTNGKAAIVRHTPTRWNFFSQTSERLWKEVLCTFAPLLEGDRRVRRICEIPSARSGGTPPLRAQPDAPRRHDHFPRRDHHGPLHGAKPHGAWNATRDSAKPADPQTVLPGHGERQ